MHPIQSVQPFKSASTPLSSLSSNIQPSKQQLANQAKKDSYQPSGIRIAAPNLNPNLSANAASIDAKQQQQQKQLLMEQQLKQELEIELDLDSSPMSSLMMNKQFMMQPQRLDNNAIQTLVCDQTKAHLILDDKEALQVIQINLFKYSYIFQ